MDSERSTILLLQFLGDPKNRDLFGKFARKYQPRIKHCCLRRGLQDADAEDLTATILLRFCERDLFDGFVFRSKGQFYAWLDTVVRNDVLTFLRNRGRKPDSWSVGNADAQEALQQVSAAVVDDLKAECAPDLARIGEARARVRARVGEKTWSAFCLSMDEGRSVEEVMELLGMSQASVWQALSRIKRKLREELSDLHEAS